MRRDEREPDRDFCEKISVKQQRKIRARRSLGRSDFWRGLSMFGLIGWSIVVPTLILTAVGIWLDSRGEGGISWTLTGILVGAALGCANAWYWINREGKDDR